jgi:hypothetical protein
MMKTVSATDPIMAIDLGKYKSVACLYEPTTAEVQFLRFTTCPAELLRLIGRHRPAVVVVEACLLSGWVHDLCLQHGVRCLVANTASEAWKFKHTHRKTDEHKLVRSVPRRSAFAQGTSRVSS